MFWLYRNIRTHCGPWKNGKKNPRCTFTFRSHQRAANFQAGSRARFAGTRHLGSGRLSRISVHAILNSSVSLFFFAQLFANAIATELLTLANFGLLSCARSFLFPTSCENLGLRLLCYCEFVRMQQLTFPVLDRKEILSYVLADAGIVLEEQNLVKPSMEAVWPVYENLALNTMGITRYSQRNSPVSFSVFYFRKGIIHVVIVYA